MDTLNIDMDDGRSSYLPGDTISGRVSWALETPPKSIELRLFWYTIGKGDQDAGLADQTVYEGPPQQDQRPFRFTLPEAPYSCSGKLISIIWALELVEPGGGLTERQEFVLSPSGSEVVLENR